MNASDTGSARSNTKHLVAYVICLLVGVLIGMNVRDDAGPRIDAPVMKLSSHTPPSAPSAPAPPSEGHFDLGTPAGNKVLKGDDWRASSKRVDGRTVAIATGPNARLSVTQALPRGEAWLAVVAKAIATASDQALTVKVYASEKEVATWSVKPRWSLFAARLATGNAAKDLRWSIGGAAAVPEAAVSARGGDRPAMAVDYMQIVVPSNAAALNPNSADGRSRLLSGFSRVAKTGSVWSDGKVSRIGLLIDPAKGGYELRLEAYGFANIAPVEVDILLGSRRVAGIALTKNKQNLSVAIPEDALLAGANEMTFKFAKSARPSDFGSSTDDRDLAACFFEFELVPDRGPSPPR